MATLQTLVERMAMGFKKWLCQKVFKTDAKVQKKLDQIITNQERIMGTQAEEALRVEALTTQVGKVYGEIQAKLDAATAQAAVLQQQITDLIDQGQQVDPVLKANIDKMARLIQETDDKIPDAGGPVVTDPTDTATDVAGTDTLSPDSEQPAPTGRRR